MEYGTVSDATGILAFSVEKTRLRACLVDIVDGDGRLVGWINVQRSRRAPLTDQLAAVIHRLGTRLGRPLWNRAQQAPLTGSSDPIREPPLLHVTGAIAPDAPLRVWLAGLSPSLSIPAARRALTSLPTEVAGVTIFAGSSAAELDPNRLARGVAEARPDALVIVGGYDNEMPEAQAPIAALCTALAAALDRLPPVQIPGIFYAGNHWAAERARLILQEIGDEVRVEIVPNLQPMPGIDDRAALVRTLEAHHWRLQQRLPGIQRISRWVSEPARLTTLDRSFIQLVDVWRRLDGRRRFHAAYRAGDRQLHVWSDAGHEGVHVAYRTSAASPFHISGWPPLSLFSGDLPSGQELPSSVQYWDQSGMAPLIATVGQVDPAAMLPALRLDLVKEIHLPGDKA